MPSTPFFISSFKQNSQYLGAHMSEDPGEISTLIFSQTSHILLKKLFCIPVLSLGSKGHG